MREFQMIPWNDFALRQRTAGKGLNLRLLTSSPTKTRQEGIKFETPHVVSYGRAGRGDARPPVLKEEMKFETPYVVSYEDN
jgi:hypothetical protein